jgi:hypothetical protein
MKPCPTGCGRKHINSVLMCGPCWDQVPAELQREVWTTRRQLERAMKRAWERSVIHTLRRERGEAAAKAIEHVKARITQRELAL